MKHSSDKIQKAIKLRKLGYSLREISSRINVSQSTLSIWLRDVSLSAEAKNRLNLRRTTGQKRGAGVRKQQVQDRSNLILEKVTKEVLRDTHCHSQLRMLTAFLYWGEGSKTQGSSAMEIINSDPTLVKTFLQLFRQSFEVDETKFRVLVHIHQYHDDDVIKRFWSEVTGIPVSQFFKSYLKPNTGKRKKVKYMGSASIRYYDVSVARELRALYNAFAQKIGASVNW